MPQYTSGSSPLARGAHVRSGERVWKVRFIPAGAGSTDPPEGWWYLHPVHPRWRGEHSCCFLLSSNARGSSPLARGAHSKSGALRRAGRFIPAGAGSTHCGHPPRFGNSVHPRWRGEHLTDILNFLAFNGSSPLARGALRTIMIQHASWRFIPAGAGST